MVEAYSLLRYNKDVARIVTSYHSIDMERRHYFMSLWVYNNEMVIVVFSIIRAQGDFSVDVPALA